MEKNVLGDVLQICCLDPMTGFFRDGLCRTVFEDRGTHTVCAIMTDEFLKFSASKGNDLMTPMPNFQFPGLKKGDKWCLCVKRWIEAEKAGKAPKIILESSHVKTLEYVSIDVLLKYSFNKII
tara:strand:- start:130 stop:498 length:369 start_codon:yes stop_codon:yes gene_type:complete